MGSSEYEKECFGDQITFWGGGVDTQWTLPFGTPEVVYQQVRERLHIFHRNGGYVFNTIHNVQGDIPIANLTAMYDAVKDFNTI